MLEITTEFIADVLGTPHGEIEQALKDGENFKPKADVEAFLKSKIEERIYKAKQSGKTEGKDWGRKELLTTKEKELKAKLGVEGNYNTIEEIVDAAIEAAKKHSTLNPDDVKNSEVYINETKRLKALLAEKDNEIKSTVQTFSKKETMRAAKDLGLRFLKEKNFVLPENEVIKEEMLDTLFEKLENDQTHLSLVDGKIVVLDANGKVKENETGTKELTFEDHFVARAKRLFPIAVADNRQSPGNKPAQEKPAPQGDFPEMKSMDDLIKAINGEKDVVKQKAIKAHYDTLVESGTIV